ncbi:hypothetical protein SteCoe_21111 [Stentor coeruleus]|uniref:Myb-like DNA-binding domain containing protein n=1 Tax=Stentor coeruleus TaxID=5963 RepID=A0A1R2BQA9_9CILI|nr:hypothetical protein SteCoe_21111 [Stentor coeruleus]
MEISNRYRKVWQIEDDLHLKEIATRYNAKDWKKIAQEVSQRISQERTAKQCRERWMHHIKRYTAEASWTESEAELLFILQKSTGSRWSRIAPFFPSKSANDIKNYFYATVRRNIRRFNNGKKEEEKIKGPIDKIIKIPEIREILSTHKSVSRKSFREKKLSSDSIEKISRICGIFSTIVPNGSIEEFEYWENYEPLTIEESMNEDAPYIDHAVLWD